MKLERKGIVLITFIVTFVILMLFSIMTSGTLSDIKGIFVALYFAVWVAAFFFVLITYVIPVISEYKRTAKKRAGQTPNAPIIPTPFRSPRSGLPLRERIAAYVAERRKEDGLQAPEPLRPSRAVPSGTRPSASSGRVTSVPTPPLVAINRETSGLESAGEGDLGDLPLPDDFGSVEDTGDNLGSLPGLEGDMDDMGDFVDEDVSSDTGGYTGEIPPVGHIAEVSAPLSPASVRQDSGTVLPDFDGDMTPDIGESDLIGEEGVEDFSSDDLLVMDEEDSLAPAPASSSSLSQGEGLSEDGLPDLDGDLEPDIMDSDLSGDEDFGDIEFMDLEPEEPKKPVK